METSILKADIFFVITSISVALVSIALTVALVYLIRILQDIKVLSGKAKDEGEKIIDDVRLLREEGERRGVGAISLLHSLFGFFMTKRKIKKSKKETEN